MKKFVNSRLERVSDFSNMIEISEHPDLTLDVVKSHPDKAWNFQKMIHLPHFDMSWVDEFPFQYWDWNELSKKATIKDVNRYPYFYWNWRILTENIPMKDIMNNPDHPWDFTSMNIKPITTEHLPFFRMFKNRIPQWKWHHHARNLNWSALRKSIDLPWIWDIEHVKIDEFTNDDVWIIQIMSDLCDWIQLTINIPIRIINENPGLPWRRDYLQWNRTTWNTPVHSIEKCVREWVAANTIKRYWKRALSDPSYKLCKSRIESEFKDLEREINKNEMSSTITFTKLRSDAITPSKATPGSIGLDLHSVDHYIVLPGQRVVVSTGLRVTLPSGTYGRIAPRSGLAVKHGLDVGAGVVDPDYTGELRVVLFNHDAVNPFIIRPGWRIAQLVVERAVDDLTVEEGNPEFDTERGEGGFGSTGV